MLFGNNRHIISASRRTDIPAFYTEWFIDKVRKGYCKVVNPYNPSQIKKVSLHPGDVAAVVFWTRRSGPLQPYLRELDGRSFNYYFLYTVTGYPGVYEKGLPDIEETIDDFLALAELIGPEKVIWRYDPVIITPELNTDYHIRNFTRLAFRLSPGTKNVIITFVKRYRHIEEKLKDMGYAVPSPGDRSALEERFLSAASAEGMRIKGCGKRDTLNNVHKGKCIDDMLMRELFGLELFTGKDRGQPEECNCIRSIDIGSYGSCLHRCVYCYASRNFVRAERRYREHDYRAEML